ncbi:MAG: DUF3575 domain-containing protein [Chitinophagales bacterium]
MKKAFLTIVAAVVFCLSSFSQNIAVGIHSGWSTYIGSNTNLSVPVGVNVEWAFNAVHSIAGRTDFNIGIRKQDVSVYYVSPEYKYYLIGETLNGFYVGGFLGFGGTTQSAYFSLGGITGYAYEFADKFNLEGNLQLGYGNFPGINQHVLHLVPTIGIRYMF